MQGFAVCLAVFVWGATGKLQIWDFVLCFIINVVISNVACL